VCFWQWALDKIDAEHTFCLPRRERLAGEPWLRSTVGYHAPVAFGPSSRLETHTGRTGAL
jgi:hypothetical protein